MNFNLTFSLGNIIEIGIILGAIYAFVRRINRIESRVIIMWNAFKKKFDVDDKDE